VSFAAITLYVASQRVIPKISVYFVVDSVWKVLDTPPFLVHVVSSSQVFRLKCCMLFSCLPYVLHVPPISHFIAVIMFGEQYNLRSSLLRTFLHLRVTSSLLGTEVFLSTMFSKMLSLLFTSPG
jgi:hypothetical protein